MSPHESAVSLAARALKLPLEEREAFLEAQCAGHPELLADTLALLVPTSGLESSMSTTPGPRPRRRLETPPPDSEPQPAAEARGLPERIGSCRILRCVGEGGMGIVYEAEQQSPRRRVAVKLMRADSWSEGFASRFRREAELLGRLEHPGIARVYEAGKARPWGDKGPELPYLVMEIVDGSPLTSHAARERLDVRARLRLIARICDAVQHAHERGVVHRDLKPANVLVDASGQPRVLDFGVARSLDTDPAAMTAHTGTSQLVGTLPYMSPEQLSGKADAVGPRSDVYALGVLAYELLAGRRPLPVAGLALAEAIRQVQEVDPPRLGTIDPALTGDVEAIVGKALAKEPERRYASAAEMAADIERHLAEVPIQARPPSTVYRATKFVRRNRRFVSAMVALFAVLVAGVIVSLALTVRARRARAAAEDARRLAEGETARARWSSYCGDVAEALTALDRDDVRSARQHLETAPADLREWTWRLATARLDDSLSTLPASPVDGLHDPAQLWTFPGGRIVARDSEGLTVAGLDGDRLTLVRRLPGVFPTVALDGTRAIQVMNERYVDVPLDDSGTAGTDLDPSGPNAALPLPGGGWVLATHDQCRVHARDGRLVASVDVPADILYAVRPDGGQVALRSGGRFLALDLGAGHSIRERDMGGEALVAAAYSPDGSLLLAVGTSGHCRAWQSQAGSSAPLWNTAVSPVRMDLLAVPPGGHECITIDQHGDVQLLSLKDGSRLRDLGRYGYFRHVAAMRSDGAALLMAGLAGGLRVLGLDAQPVGAPRLGSEAQVAGVAFVPGRPRVVALDAAGNLRLFREPGAEDPGLLKGHASYVYGAAVDDAGRRIASVAWDGTLRAWDAATGRPLGTLVLHAGPGRAVTWMPGDSAIAATSPEVYWWRLGEATAAGRFAAAGQCAVGWHEAAARVIVGDEFGCVSSWDPASGDVRPLVELGDSGEPHLQVASGTIPEATFFSSGRHVTRLDAASGELAWRTAVPCDGIGGLGVDVIGAEVVAGCLDGSIHLLDGDSGAYLRAIAPRGGSPVFSVALHPDGRTLAVGTHDGLVSIWDVPRGAPVASLRGHLDYVHALAFSPDGTLLVSGSGDSTLRVWDTLRAADRASR